MARFLFFSATRAKGGLTNTEKPVPHAPGPPDRLQHCDPRAPTPSTLETKASEMERASTFESSPNRTERVIFFQKERWHKRNVFFCHRER